MPTKMPWSVFAARIAKHDKLAGMRKRTISAEESEYYIKRKRRGSNGFLVKVVSLLLPSCSLAVRTLTRSIPLPIANHVIALCLCQ